MMNALRDYAAVHKYYDAVRVAEYIHEHCPEEAKEVIRQAELLLENTFVFTD